MSIRQSNSITFRRLWIIFVLVALPFGFESGEEVGKYSIFNDVEPDPIRFISFPDLGAQVTHRKGMFSPVYLPFEYEYKSGVYDAQQPITFPSLVAFKFDFFPDMFSTRHPTFIFRRTPVNILSDETEKIINYIGGFLFAAA